METLALTASGPPARCYFPSSLIAPFPGVCTQQALCIYNLTLQGHAIVNGMTHTDTLHKILKPIILSLYSMKNSDLDTAINTIHYIDASIFALLQNNLLFQTSPESIFQHSFLLGPLSLCLYLSSE